MKSIDIKSVIIGILGTILVFVSIGATDKNLGDITVTSIDVIDKDGKPAARLGVNENGGMLAIYNADGELAVGLMSTENGGGLGISSTNEYSSKNNGKSIFACNTYHWKYISFSIIQNPCKYII